MKGGPPGTNGAGLAGVSWSGTSPAGRRRAGLSPRKGVVEISEAKPLQTTSR